MSAPRDLRFVFPLMRGDDVRAVQQALTVLRVDPPPGTVDGIFGNATRLSVMRFQSANGLSPDGVVGQLTRGLLLRRAEQALAPPLPPGMVAEPVAPLIRAGASAPPLARGQAITVRDWLLRHFRAPMQAAVAGKPYDVLLLCAIAAKETGPVWLRWIDRMPPDEVLARCVFDASGDFPGTSRLAFPRDTAQFRAEMGDALAEDLIAEANVTRRARGMDDERWVYKGYGLFQYDLQHIRVDPDFFRKKQWRDIAACIDRATRVLDEKWRAASGNERTRQREMVRMYNGRGERAESYADHVLTMYGWMQ